MPLHRFHVERRITRNSSSDISIEPAKSTKPAHYLLYGEVMRAHCQDQVGKRGDIYIYIHALPLQLYALLPVLSMGAKSRSKYPSGYHRLPGFAADMSGNSANSPCRASSSLGEAGSTIPAILNPLD